MGVLFYIYLASILPLAVMIFSDFRQRAIDISWLALFAASILFASIIKYGVVPSFLNLTINIAVLSCMLGFAIVYWRIRYGKWENPVNRSIGLGDIIFIVAVSPLFEIKAFIVFLLVSMSSCLLVWHLAGLETPGSNTIPLVSGMGIIMLCFFIKEFAGI